MEKNTSKDYMAEALLQLMAEKDLNSITVNDIARKSGLSRATWFRHFESKRDAIVYALCRRWDYWAEEHQLKHPNLICQENIDSFIDYAYYMRNIRKLLEYNNLHSTILDSFLTILVENNEPDNSEDFMRRTFVTYGITGISEAWAFDKYKLPKEEVADLLKTLISNNITEGLFKNL